ncbi:hypothetical protein BC830DRAFT_321220 [Chytriomyces sp. MP71]|nr:hypothetical protein BC830DRAFT_321220 [Chytriomyces sp. MP71]
MAGEGGVGTKQYDGEFELHVKTKVNFGLYHELLETFRSFVNIAPLPKTKSETIQRSPVYSSGDSVVQRKDKFTIMYPSDGGKITVHRDQHLNFRQDIRTSIDYKDTHIIFASSEQSKNGPYLTAVLENDVVFSVAEIDGLSNVVLSCANGLIIEFRNNGTIVQKHDALLSSQMSDGTVKGNPLEELSRVIMQDGTVIRYLNNTLVEVLFSDGTTAMSSKEGWITTSNDGTRKMTNSAGESSDLVGIKYARETIIALNETIITREDMVIATQKKDGSLITEHADGTLLQTDVTAGVVMVEKEGMAKVIFKGDGKSVLLKLKDGSIVEKTESDHAKAKYKISDEYNTFEFETSLDGLSSFRVKSSPDQFVTYKFDWMNGTLETLDSSGTKFIVTSSGACSTVEESQVPLASAGDNVVRNKCPGFVRSLVDTPILPLDSSARNPPRLFIIDENGSGIQLLRDLDLVPYFKKQLHNPNCEILEEILEELCVTLIGKEYGQTEGSNDIVIYRQLTRHGEISANKRAQIKADIDAYSQVKAKMDFVPKPQNWQETGASLEATTAGFQEVAPIAFEDAENVEAVEVPPVRRPTALVLGQSRQKTIEELMKLYKIPKRGQMIQEGENKIKKEVHHLLKEERLTKKRQSNILDASH